MPATAATWKSIDKNLQDLESLIKAGKLGDLGHPAYTMANLGKTLPGQSGALRPDKLAQVSGSVKVVGGYVMQVDKAGEAGVEANLKLLKDTLNSLRAICFAPKVR